MKIFRAIYWEQGNRNKPVWFSSEFGVDIIEFFRSELIKDGATAADFDGFKHGMIPAILDMKRGKSNETWLTVGRYLFRVGFID